VAAGEPVVVGGLERLSDGALVRATLVERGGTGAAPRPPGATTR
jgi:hypothetical protein